MTFTDIIGLKIVAVKGIPKGYQTKKESKDVPTEYILFSDGETVLRLDEQDYYDYHDCNSSARELNLSKSKEMWDRIISYPDSTTCDFMW
jgi:hypothetical protein